MGCVAYWQLFSMGHLSISLPFCLDALSSLHNQCP